MENNSLTIKGIKIQNGEKIGCVFSTAKLFYGVYEQKTQSIVWCDDHSKTPIDIVILTGINIWLEGESVIAKY